MFQKIYNFARYFRTTFMNHPRKISLLLRNTLLIGWAVAVVWIYMGNLVNFHQHRIWGKQLMPVECSSTRVKEKDAASFVKNDRNAKHLDSGSQFDFSAPDQLLSEIIFIEIGTPHHILYNFPVLHQEIQAFSFRGPPSA